SVAEEVRALGRRALPLISDVRRAEAIDELVQRSVSELGGIDILINNAGAARGKDRVPVVDLDEAIWRNVIETNLTGTFLMSRAVARQMIKQGRGGRGEQWERVIKERVPLGRAGTGEDIAHLTVFLCTPKAEWITGQSYIVDGGTVRQG